ncbi:MAG: thimet oligopeptidase, partial [Verrucomicrobiota bacterium]
MNWNCIQVFVLASIMMTLGGIAQPAKQSEGLQEFQKRAEKFKGIISLPQFETTSNEVRASIQQTIATGNAALDVIGALNPKKVTFKNTILALDDMGYQMGLTANRLSLLKETSTSASLRDTATDAIKELEEWMVGLDYREDVYKSIKAYAETKPKLKGEDEKLFSETIRDYRRAGLDLPKAQRDEVERLRKELSRLTTDYESNITKAQKAVK